MVGDADQLPSVGPGRVFSDILRSGEIPAVRLTEVFRQAEDSRIVRCAHEINRGEHPEFRRNTGGLFLLNRPEQERASDTIVELCAERLPKRMGIQPEEIQVLTPDAEGGAGLNFAQPPAPGGAEPAREGQKRENFWRSCLP